MSLQVILARRIAHVENDSDVKALIDQGFIVVEKEDNTDGHSGKYLVVAAPLLATVLLRRDKLAVPDDVELPEEGKWQDPW